MAIKVGKYTLDKEQEKIVKDDTKHLLVVAGAGAGKTLTILGKIKYLIEKKKIKPEEIICVSFTNASKDDLKEKINKELNINMEVYTFHKLALKALKGRNLEIADSDLLEHIIHKYLQEDALKHIEALKTLLQYFNLKDKVEYINFYEIHKQEITALENLLSKFTHLFKANNYEIKDFLKFLNRAKRTFNVQKYKKEKLFLKLALQIYLEYKDYLELNNEIDFDDMLIEAKTCVEKNNVFHSTKFIIIDEFQDTSKVRFDFIKSILNETNSSLLVVGDDFQSIYRFTGCDLDLFLSFKTIFKNSKILKIQNTYRNSQELIYIAGKFIMKNKRQIRKNLKSSKNIKQPIEICYYKNAKKDLTKLILDIYNSTKQKIMILGRNNNDINYYLDLDDFKINNNKIIYLYNRNIDITFLTIHKSKGLESDNVIILNLRDDVFGFPNQIKNDDVLRFVSAKTSYYKFDEERRLFYVALTRTKNKVYLLCDKEKESTFVKELKRDFDDKIIMKKL